MKPIPRFNKAKSGHIRHQWNIEQSQIVSRSSSFIEIQYQRLTLPKKYLNWAETVNFAFRVEKRHDTGSSSIQDLFQHKQNDIQNPETKKHTYAYIHVWGLGVLGLSGARKVPPPSRVQEVFRIVARKPKGFRTFPDRERGRGPRSLVRS